MHVRKDDLVVVITGKDRGKQGKVLRVIPEEGRVIVERVNLVHRHTRPTQKNRQGGIVEKEAPIAISNVMLVDGRTGKGTRTKHGEGKGGKKVRVAVKTGTVFDG